MNPGELEQSHFAQWEVEQALFVMEEDPTVTVEWEPVEKVPPLARVVVWFIILAVCGLFWSGVGLIIYKLVTR